MFFLDTLILVSTTFAFSAFVGWHILPVFLPGSETFTLQEIRFEQTTRELQHLESLLRTVRRTRQRIHWQGLEPEWQLSAILATDFELEWLLVSQVWGSRGEAFALYRLCLSPYRREIEQAEKQLETQIQFA